MSSGWVGPGANSSPQNQNHLAMYNSLKAEVDREQKEKRDILNAERASQGLPPGKLVEFFSHFLNSLSID